MSELVENNDKTKYWSSRAIQNMAEMHAAKEYGLFPKKEGWRNVVEHVLVEAEVVDVLAEAVDLSPQDRREVYKAALLHDLYKRRQRELIDKKGDPGQYEAAQEQDEFILERGYPKRIVSLTNSVGHISLQGLVKDSQAQILELRDNIDLPTLIIHYADDITWQSKVVSLDERIDALENRRPPYPEASLGGDIFAGRTYYEVQRIVGHLAEDKLATLVGVQSTELIDLIRERINQRIINYSAKTPS